jgi:hypothetical protein
VPIVCGFGGICSRRSSCQFVGPATPTSPVATKIVCPCAARQQDLSSILKNDYGSPHCAQLIVITGQRLSVVAA